MKRKILTILLCVILVSLLMLPAAADSQLPRIVDNADLLTAEEEQQLEDAAYDFCAQYSLDIVILTVDSLNGKPIAAFADDYYDENGYGVGTDYSGLLLVVAMSERELYISTCGDAINRLNDRELDDIISNISLPLSDGNYYDAFEMFFGFVSLSVDYDPGRISDTSGTEPQINWLLSVLIGIVAAAITVFIMVSTMNTKRPKYSAGDYVKSGSYDLYRRHDMFLYSQVSKVRRQQNNGGGHGGTSVHRSSGGRSHGGRGGRF